MKVEHAIDFGQYTWQYLGWRFVVSPSVVGWENPPPWARPDFDLPTYLLPRQAPGSTTPQ